MCAMLRAHPELWRTSRPGCIALEGGEACKRMNKLANPFPSIFQRDTLAVRLLDLSCGFAETMPQHPVCMVAFVLAHGAVVL